MRPGAAAAGGRDRGRPRTRQSDDDRVAGAGGPQRRETDDTFTGRNDMPRRTLLGAAAALALTAGGAAAQDAKTFYWISHGSPADPVWTYFLQGAEQFAAATGHEAQHLVPFGRRALAAGGGARGDRGRGGRRLLDLARSRLDGRRGRRGAGGRHPDRQLQHLGRRARLDRLRRRRPAGVRPHLGAVPGRQRPRVGGRLRLDAGRGARRLLRRRGGEGHRHRLRADGRDLGGDGRDAGPGRDHPEDGRTT